MIAENSEPVKNVETVPSGTAPNSTPHLERVRAMQEAIEERFADAEYAREVRRLGIENELFSPEESWTP